jgi:hypothetical protein
VWWRKWLTKGLKACKPENAVVPDLMAACVMDAWEAEYKRRKGEAVVAARSAAPPPAMPGIE